MAKVLIGLAFAGGLTLGLTWFTPDKPEATRTSHPGKALAELHCVRCHLLPEPEDLPREKWPFVITWMANYLGYPETGGPFKAIVDPREIQEWRSISPEGLGQIRDYFTSRSRPGRELTPPRPHPDSVLPGFEIAPLELPGSQGSITTLLHLDPPTGRLYAGTADTRRLRVVDRSGRLLLDTPLPSTPVSVEPSSSGFRLTLMGHFERDAAEGQVIDVSSTGRVRPLLEGYHRLAGSRTADLDGDGRGELVTAGFGDHSDGRVSIFWEDGEQILESRSGALGIEIDDLDGDGDPDLVLLIAQAHQELVVFRNDGDRAFRRITLRKQRPGFGYNHLSLADFDGDGLRDIITSAGNNMEMIDPPLRPHHGVRVLMNRGGLKFTERAFLPLHGALKTKACDFDRDGDLDLASIAFYPDWEEQDPTTFVLYENRGDFSFHPRTLHSRGWGRWMALEVGDADGDGRPEILLGSASMTAGVPTRLLDRIRPRLERQPRLLVLRNRY